MMGFCAAGGHKIYFGTIYSMEPMLLHVAARQSIVKHKVLKTNYISKYKKRRIR